ncbi:hypothetical protein [Vagococcus fluvialis]|uniref:hypothetical protein n=1 Tax=Vagococcus fluvialis TaxID=2738 RepID=UPI0037891A55
MKFNCLSCQKVSSFDKNILQKINQRRNEAMMNALKYRKNDVDPTTMRNDFFITDKELYCSNCLKKINVVKQSTDDLRFETRHRNMEINNLLDFSYENYFSKKSQYSSCEKENYIFLFTYIEECFSLSDEIVNELQHIFDRFENHLVTSYEDFTYMYYYNNTILKINSLIEKMIIFYSTALNVQFRANKLQNKPDYLLKQLRKEKDFDELEFSSVIKNYREKGWSSDLSETRKVIDHDISYNRGFEMMAILNRIKIVQKILSNIYNSFNEMIFVCDTTFKTIKIPVDYVILRSHDVAENDLELIVDTEVFFYAKKFGERVNTFIHDQDNLINLSQDVQKRGLYDILNRLHEVTRANVQVNNMINSAITKNCPINEIYLERIPEKNYESLINDMLFRAYSVNDKLARYLVSKFSLYSSKTYIYFEDIEEIIDNTNNKAIISSSSNKELFMKVKNLLHSKAFLFLSNERNRLAHIRDDLNNLSNEYSEYLNLLRLNNFQEYYKMIDPIIEFLDIK